MMLKIFWFYSGEVTYCWHVVDFYIDHICHDSVCFEATSNQALFLFDLKFVFWGDKICHDVKIENSKVNEWAKETLLCSMTSICLIYKELPYRVIYMISFYYLFSFHSKVVMITLGPCSW